MSGFKRMLLALILAFAGPALAGGDFSQVFVGKAKSVPSNLISLGYARIGTLDLTDLVNQALGINAVLSDRVPEMNGNGRLSAHWEVVNGVRTVYVNPAWWNKFPEQQSLLALHEILGVSGFLDDQYWISTSLWTLSLPEAATALNDHNRSQIVAWIAKNASARLPKGTQMAGGVVGVGGGGEGGTLFVKMHALQRTLKELSGAQSPEDRNSSLASLAHYLSSPLTVTWGPLRRSK